MLDDSKYYRGDGSAWKRGPMIGHGGQGRVFLATALEWANRLPPRMAVKSTTCKLTHLKEQFALTNIGPSPFIIAFAGADKTTSCRDQTRCYDLLFEYASGGTLGGLLRKTNFRPLPESDVIRYTRDILRGLHHIHSRGYVHCDIKPDNILLVGSGNNNFVAKIGDLGFAKKAKTERDRWSGTVVYLSPESVSKNVQESAADIWALGCTVREMLQGELHVKDDDPRRVSGEGLAFVEACMKFRPEDRWTAEMLLEHPFVKVVDVVEEEMRKPLKKRRVMLSKVIIDVDNIIYIDDD